MVSVAAANAPAANGGTSVFHRDPAAAGAERYHTRELSWLAFNRRVLEEAQDAGKPLLERCKFLAIVSSNLDEFVMVRLAELHGEARNKTAAGHSAKALLAAVHREVSALVSDQYTCWRTSVEPALAKEGVEIVRMDQWTQADRETLRSFFRDRLEPVLTPQAVDPTRPFPLVPNRGITVAVRLKKSSEIAAATSASPAPTRRALVSVPAGNRLIALVSQPGRFALVEDVVMCFLDRLFSGYEIVGRCLLRMTRDGNVEIDEEQAADLLTEIEQELSSRDHGHAVRLELSTGADPELRDWLVESLDLDRSDLVPVDGPLDFTFLFGLGDRVDNLPRGPRAELRDAALPVVVHPNDAEWEDCFGRIRQAEVLLHHPFQSFQRVVELVERAAADPLVLAIKMTLYRTSGNSPIAKALMRAAQSGKQVTVLVELKARFDEAANIKWARALEEAGAHVVYGLVGYKVHAKLLLIIRREEDGIRRYCHLGTGNYNDRTARLYTDLSYMTANEAVGRDVAALFNLLTGYSEPPAWERLAVAPLTLRSKCADWIRREADHARNGRRGRIIAKFNALVDEPMCDELYAASAAGVEIDLIVRGMCILKAGVPGLSENIRVRSLVGRFLEHSRIYHFANDGDPVYAIASADWMGRNLDRRVESLVQITDESICARLATILETCLADQTQARVQQSDGTYRRLLPAVGPANDALTELVREASESAKNNDPPSGARPRFRPRTKGDAAG
ncbi:polyphosphate kinase [Planctomycetota bacterium]|nr:polyphosphate kinase [Planctomycetota bacterium]